MQEIKQVISEHFLLSKYEIDLHTGVVHVQGDLYLKKSVSRLPVNFGKVTGDFDCAHNELETLEGAPHWVGGTFDCDSNRLTTLEHAPTYVGADFFCSHNPLSSIQHAPKHVGESFVCKNCHVHSLKGLPDHIGQDLLMIGQKITSMEGWDSPTQINGTVYLDYHKETPLLRCVQVGHVDMSSGHVTAHPKVQQLINKYAGKGKSHMLNFALELKQMGLSENARW